MNTLSDVRLCIVGLGYVGLPLAVEFGKKFPTTGFDLNATRVANLRRGSDATLEVSDEELAAVKSLKFTAEPQEIANCNVFIVAVPTPIDAAKRPDFRPLEGASRTVAGHELAVTCHAWCQKNSRFVLLFGVITQSGCIAFIGAKVL